MAYLADSVVVDLIGNTGGLDGPVDSSARKFERNMSTIEKSATRAERQIVKSSGAMANAQRNLGRQVSDIGTQLASGQSPFLILAQQAPQVADALADTGGKAAVVARFFAGPWGAALLAAGSVAGVLVSKLFGLEKAHDAAQAAAKAQAAAEKQLADVLQGTTNAGETARVAALGLAQAHIYEARAALNAARSQLSLAKARAAAAAAGSVGGRSANYGGVEVSRQADETARRQAVDVQQAESDLRVAELRQRNLERAATNARGVEAAKEKAKGDRAGDAAARKAEAARKREEAQAQKEAREAERQSDEQRKGVAEILRSRVELAQAQADLTSDTRAQDEVLRKKIEADRQINRAEIEDREGISKAQRAELLAINDRVSDLQLRKVNMDEAQRYLEEQTSLQRVELETARDAANTEMDLADTRARRREIALRLLDMAVQQERLEQEAIIASKQSTDVQKQIAQKRLDSINQVAALQRQSVERQHEGPGRAYLRDLNAASAQMGDAIDGAAVDGLERLNDELADAITGAKSLGEAFSNVADQIINDLVRIAVRQAIIKPLAENLFGGSGGGGDWLSSVGGTAANLGAGSNGIASGDGANGLGAIFKRIFGRASGGHVAPRSIHRVNESSGGVELLRMGPQGGEVIPLGRTKAAMAGGGGTTKVYNISVSADNSVTPAGFARGLAGQILAEAKRMDAATAQGTLRAMPGRLSQYQNDTG